MKKYKVKVNNKLYEVEVEEISSATVVEKEEKNLEQQDEVKVERKSTTENVTGEKVLAPLPGNISSIEVNKGDQINEGDVLFILEAMKMENEITAPANGTIKEIYVAQGATVDTEELLAVIE